MVAVINATIMPGMMKAIASGDYEPARRYLASGSATVAEKHELLINLGEAGHDLARCATRVVSDEEVARHEATSLLASEDPIALNLGVAKALQLGLALPESSIIELRATARGMGDAELLAEIVKLQVRSSSTPAKVATKPAPPMAIPTRKEPTPMATNPKVEQVVRRRDELVAQHLSAVNAARSMNRKPPLSRADLATSVIQGFYEQALVEAGVINGSA